MSENDQHARRTTQDEEEDGLNFGIVDVALLLIVLLVMLAVGFIAVPEMLENLGMTAGNL